ncbi:MAG: glycosyltransferase family 1 protein [Proteobacteria bacterium]|nr:glycosyltransferase family 1 protein [Pseudomonadota bacterium]MCP4918062.1 glycosyltransferase family 1 protein [Pseudomonadota bacterium]
MKRAHLFEFGDQDWFPPLLRDAGTAYISRVVELTDMMKGALPGLTKALASTSSNQIIDLCSGAAGPAALMQKELREAGHDVTVTCTDKFPNRTALTASGLAFETEPVDVMRVPQHLHGVRTLFNAFHHFQPAEARRILEDAVRSGQPIAIYEFVGRDAIQLLGLPGIWLGVCLLLPTVRPYNWLWAPLTYMLPLIPASIVWDGFASCMRVYDPDELRELTEGLDSYDWDIGRFKMPKTPGHGTYLVGTPKP